MPFGCQKSLSQEQELPQLTGSLGLRLSSAVSPPAPSLLHSYRIWSQTKFQIWPRPEILQFLVTKTSIKCNFWKPGMKRLKGRLIFKVIWSMKHWAWLMFSHKYYGKYGFLFNKGWPSLADCLASVFARCWVYFKLLFKPHDARTALSITGTIPVKKSMSCKRQLLGNGTPQTGVWLPPSFVLSSCASCISVRNLMNSSATCFLATQTPV